MIVPFPFVLAQAQPGVATSISLAEAGVAAVVLFGFAAFLWAILHEPALLWTGNSGRKMEAFYQAIVAERDKEIAELKDERRDQNGQIERMAQDMVRVSDQYQQTMREFAITGLSRGRSSGDER